MAEPDCGTVLKTWSPGSRSRPVLPIPLTYLHTRFESRRMNLTLWWVVTLMICTAYQPGTVYEWNSLHNATSFSCLIVLSLVNITITSSPRLGVDTVCDNQEVTLMCHSDQTIGDMITWHWSNHSQHGDTITVVASMTGIEYTCVVSNIDEQQSKNIIVVANGKKAFS